VKQTQAIYLLYYLFSAPVCIAKRFSRRFSKFCYGKSRNNLLLGKFHSGLTLVD